MGQNTASVLASIINILKGVSAMQSDGSRFSKRLRPISEFLDMKNVSKPETVAELQSRTNYNLSHFSSNYAVVFGMLSLYALLTNWLLLFDVILVVAGMWLIGHLGGHDVQVGTFRATSNQLCTGLLGLAVPLGLLANVFSTFLWLTMTSGVVIFGHASFMDKPIDNAFSGIVRAGSDRKPWGQTSQQKREE